MSAELAVDLLMFVAGGRSDSGGRNLEKFYRYFLIGRFPGPALALWPARRLANTPAVALYSISDFPLKKG